MEHIVIGIEGLVGSGKTSICRELINRVPNSIVFHGGNLYRAIVYSIMQNNKELSENMNMLKLKMEHIDIKKIMDMLKVEIKIENSETVVYVAGKKIDEDKIQSKEASMAVSVAGGSADNTNLFLFARKLINTYKEEYNVILSGRSLNIIYPELDYHFFITASLEDLREHIIKRDELQKAAGFYDYSDKTIVIDVSDCKNVKESTDKVCEFMNIIHENKKIFNI